MPGDVIGACIVLGCCLFWLIYMMTISIIDWYHGGTKPSYCQGCDQLQPSACFRWTEIGLWRCNVCRREPQLLDQAKNLTQKPKNWAEAILYMDQKIDNRCQGCDIPSALIVNGQAWCRACYRNHWDEHDGHCNCNQCTEFANRSKTAAGQYREW